MSPALAERFFTAEPSGRPTQWLKLNDDNRIFTLETTEIHSRGKWGFDP